MHGGRVRLYKEMYRRLRFEKGRSDNWELENIKTLVQYGTYFISMFVFRGSFAIG